MSGLNPYACYAQEAVCAVHPGVTTANRLLGCVPLDSDCVPLRCKAYRCGMCPANCGAGDSVEACLLEQAREPAAQPCTPFYQQQLDQLVASYLPEVTWDGVRYTASGTGVKSLAAERYANAMRWCADQACACPLVPHLKADVPQSVCGGVGQCEVPEDAVTGYCVCPEGYSGDACEIRTGCGLAWNVRAGALATCGGAGQGGCDAETNKCVCEDGWSGTTCEQRTCPSTHGVVCGGNGLCDLMNQCVCHEGFSGPACNCYMKDGARVCGSAETGVGGEGPSSGYTLQQQVDRHALIIGGAVVIVLVIVALAATSSSTHAHGVLQKNLVLAGYPSMYGRFRGAYYG